MMIRNWLLQIAILSSIIFFSSCGGCGNNKPINPLSKNQSKIKASHVLLNEGINSGDTLIVQTSEELINQIGSNRVIKLINTEYNLKSTLLIEGIENLKIIGADSSILKMDEANTTVVKLLNSSDIHFDNLEMGNKTKRNQAHKGEPGILRISQSHHITISNCKILGAGTSGLFTKDTHNLKFTNSEITKCTFLIFELEKSHHCEFINSKFYDNSFSVLGGFTNSTKNVIFTNCEFTNNTSEMEGNPAFNFMDNWKDFDEPIVFTNCTFENNKGFKWYGDKIKLNNCKVDSSGFIGFPENQ